MATPLHDPPTTPARPAPALRPWANETLPFLLERLFREGFTGQLLMHFKDGYPRAAETSCRRTLIIGLGASLKRT